MKERDYRLDLLRVIAILGVLTVHSTNLDEPIASAPFLVHVLYGSLVRGSVPLFFACSGALLLSPQRELSTKRVWQHHIVKILVPMYVWAMLYKIVNLVRGDILNVGTLVQSVKEVLFFKHVLHFYYLHIILLVYAMVPITRILTKNVTKKQLQYCLFIWFLLGILYPTVYHIWPFSILEGIPTQWRLTLSYAAIGYGLLGDYLYRYPLSKRTGIFSILIGYLFTFSTTVGMSIYRGEACDWFYEGASFGPFLLTVGIFTLCLHAKFDPAAAKTKWISWLSKASFCVFLIHLFILFDLRAALYSSGIPIFLAIPLNVVLLFAICAAAYAVLSKIPVVNRWLV